MIKRKVWGILTAATIAAGALTIGAPAAQASGPSYCNVYPGGCDLSNTYNTGGFYAVVPYDTNVGMICWIDAQWFDGTNRWFKVSTVEGTGYMIANQVSNQTTVGHC
jgi:hypothetical protein